MGRDEVGQTVRAFSSGPHVVIIKRLHLPNFPELLCPTLHPLAGRGSSGSGREQEKRSHNRTLFKDQARPSSKPCNGEREHLEISDNMGAVNGKPLFPA